MKGIYKFTNIINNKIYIGKSLNLENRYKSHKRNYNNLNLPDYNTKFYRALRKYGFDNFRYEIIIESDSFSNNDLNLLEQYYIQKYDSINNGYNIQKGGGDTAIPRKLTNEQIFQIKELIQNTLKSFREISKEFNISTSLVSMINSGTVWNTIGKYSYPIRKNTMNHQGELNARTKFKDKDIINIRKYFVTHSLNEVYDKYKDKCSFSEMKKICYGVQFKHLPIYKKRQKQWILNGTCIDYPC